MKLNLKTIAAAVALVAAGTSANAAIVAGANGSLVIAAFNTVTHSYYVRDTGFLLNDFLPSSVTTAAGDGGVTGTRTPDAGLLLDKTNTATFGADATFASWLTGQTLSDIRWTAFANDQSSAAGTNNVSRMILASSSATPVVFNSNVTAAVGSTNAFVGVVGSTTGPTNPPLFDTNLSVGAATLGTLDSASSLFYFARSTGTLANATAAVATRYGNATGFATVTLESDGDFVYSLAGEAPAAVPVPAAIWLLGSGLMGLGGMVRRRKAAAAAA